MGRYLVFDVGCIECGESSAVVGIYATKDEAKAECAAAEERQFADPDVLPGALQAARADVERKVAAAVKAGVAK